MHTREYEELNQMILAMQRQVRSLIVTGGGGGSGAPTSASYVVMDLNASLSGERRLVAGTGIVITDGGANGDVEIAVNLGSPFGLGSTGALVLLEQHTASSSAQLDFTTSITSAYDIYQIELVGLIPATDGVTLYMLVSTDGGSTFQSTNYKYGIISVTAHDGSNNHAFSEAGSEFQLGGTVENTTSASSQNGMIKMYNPLSASRIKGFLFDVHFTGSDAHYYNWKGQGFWASTAAVNALRFKYDSGNIAEGTIRIYGIAKS